jgi:hypothetical protein
MISEAIQFLAGESQRLSGNIPSVVAMTPAVYDALKKEMSEFSGAEFEDLKTIQGMRISVETDVKYAVIAVK